MTTPCKVCRTPVACADEQMCLDQAYASGSPSSETAEQAKDATSVQAPPDSATEVQRLRRVLRPNGDAYQVLLNVANGIDSPGQCSMAVSAIIAIDRALAESAPPGQQDGDVSAGDDEIVGSFKTIEEAIAFLRRTNKADELLREWLEARVQYLATKIGSDDELEAQARCAKAEEAARAYLKGSAQ